MKCSICKKEINGLVLNRANSTPGDIGSTVQAVAYCCPECQGVLGVKSSPIIRNSEFQKLQKDFGDLKSLVEQTLRKLAAKGLS